MNTKFQIRYTYVCFYWNDSLLQAPCVCAFDALGGNRLFPILLLLCWESEKLQFTFAVTDFFLLVRCVLKVGVFEIKVLYKFCGMTGPHSLRRFFSSLFDRKFLLQFIEVKWVLITSSIFIVFKWIKGSQCYFDI